MARALARQLSLGLFFKGANGFAPFAGVEELKPRRLRDFCGEVTEPGDDGHRGLRWCQHSFSKRLEDGGDVELSWRMHADPDSILSLDTEAEHGVRLVACSPSELELELPESHLEHAAPGKLVVGSRFAHRCGHLPDSHLYHKVLEVKRRQPWGTGAATGPATTHRVRLSTQELPSWAHTVRFLGFSFSYMPAEATDLVSHPEMRTDYGLNREFLRNGRRLLSPWDLVKKLTKVKGVDADDGGFKHDGTSGGSISTQNGILNFVPKQVSNFGWNWNFFMNTTESPNFTITEPGVQGIVKLRKPYIKVHSGIFLNFTSVFEGITSVPKVNWQAGMRGHGYVQGRVLAVLNTTASTGMDPLRKINISVLEQFREPQWFGNIDFATGHMPLSFEPGFQFNAKLYHKGGFHGAFAFAGKTHGILAPTLSYDSLIGFDMDSSGSQLLDTTVIPPFWFIFTKRFEMGLLLRPSFMMRGDFAGLEKATVAIEMDPYVNLTITRSGTGSQDTEETRSLTVYPFRVMGLTDVQIQTKYKVKVEAFGKSVETSSELNWGDVQFRDHVSKFNMGQVTKRSATEQQVKVTLYSISDNAGGAKDIEIGSGVVQCTSLLSGECHPSPPIAHIQENGVDKATVELAIVWEDNPSPWFAAKIRGVGVSFPQVVLRQDKLESTFSSTEGGAVRADEQELAMHLVYGGRTYLVPILGDLRSQQTSMRGNTMVEFGPAFLETWLPCSQAAGSKCESPRLELYYRQKQVASANLPQIEWTSSTAMQGTHASWMSGSNTLNVPCTVALYKSDSQESIAVVTMNAEVLTPDSSSLIFLPTSASQVPLTSAQPFVWTVSNVDEGKVYPVTLTPLRLNKDVLPSKLADYANYPKVSNKVLEPVANRSETVNMKCSRVAIATMSADEAPCSFTHNIVIGLGFSAGDLVTVRIQWSKGGQQHQIYTAPFEVVPKATAKQLLKPQLQEPPRRLFSKSAWNNRIGQHKKGCSRKDLRFRLGAGFLFRGRVDNIGVPKGYPMIGGLDEAPQLTTGFKRYPVLKPNASDLSTLLPKEICASGLCTGELPGCTNATFNSMSFPKLWLNFSRPFHYSQKKQGKFHGLMREVLAYAFSTLPEVVDVVIKELNSTSTSTTTQFPITAGGSPTAVPALPTVTTAAPTAPATQDNGAGAFRKWWTTRRLSVATEPAAPQVEEPAEPQHQVSLYFREGVHFTVDRPLVEMMLRHGYFEEVEDDATEELGPLRITSFILDQGIQPGVSQLSDAPEARLPQLARGPAPRLLAAAAGAAALSLATAAWALQRAGAHREVKAALTRVAPGAKGAYAVAPDTGSEEFGL